MEKEELLLEQWKQASKLHRHEDYLTWQKFNYFITTNGILLSVIGAAWTIALQYEANIRDLGLVISSFGAFISFVWSIIQRRGQLYQKYRVAQARKIEVALKINEERVLTLYEKGLNEQNLIPKPKYLGKVSTLNLIIGLGIFLTVGWLILFTWFWIN